MTSLNFEILESIRELQRDGDSELLVTLVNMYLDGVPERVARIEKAVQSGNPDALASEAHALKSSSMNLGATQVTAFCKELEDRGRKKEMKEVGEFLARLKLECSKVEIELRSLPEMKTGATKKAA